MPNYDRLLCEYARYRGRIAGTLRLIELGFLTHEQAIEQIREYGDDLEAWKERDSSEHVNAEEGIKHG